MSLIINLTDGTDTYNRTRELKVVKKNRPRATTRQSIIRRYPELGPTVMNMCNKCKTSFLAI